MLQWLWTVSDYSLYADSDVELNNWSLTVSHDDVCSIRWTHRCSLTLICDKLWFSSVTSRELRSSGDARQSDRRPLKMHSRGNWSADAAAAATGCWLDDWQRVDQPTASIIASCCALPGCRVACSVCQQQHQQLMQRQLLACIQRDVYATRCSGLPTKMTVLMTTKQY